VYALSNLKISVNYVVISETSSGHTISRYLYIRGSLETVGPEQIHLESARVTDRMRPSHGGIIGVI
jgi:hypothetical protein